MSAGTAQERFEDKNESKGEMDREQLKEEGELYIEESVY